LPSQPNNLYHTTEYIPIGSLFHAQKRKTSALLVIKETKIAKGFAVCLKFFHPKNFSV
jgi:hypothetical protein